MTDADIEFASPRFVAAGVMEVGPFFDRLGSGGYFVAKGIEGRREIHWYTEGSGVSYPMTRDEAFDKALDAVDTPHVVDERLAA
ncbi:hypothetical protein WK15_06005 [Burkholderia ubonensis]|uniref:hypothetical protein n=1 Tax=Burkholderia ubonensis TaxID=101571 RepID=UPI00075903BA|nr:hypothetical protein [Burkholderia ubonensis]KVR30736.1 hypothetical protein WK15_06005 [Burkholderia ubonensis]KVT77919.1 hypothetical protein WK58_09695 [Burkholderia ubonensis]KVX83968.1 hypothetical protein WL10_25805 [Burkholderia ubonensis]